MTFRELLIGKSLGRSLIRGLSLAAVIMAASRFVLVPVRAHGISMLPTYHEGQFIFVNRFAYRSAAAIQRGDVVAITFENGRAVLVKRIIALPGESVRIVHGDVFINGAPLTEPYVKYRIPWEMAESAVGPDEVFVIGDNRSMPARLHEHGLADRGRILGRAIY